MVEEHGGWVNLTFRDERAPRRKNWVYQTVQANLAVETHGTSNELAALSDDGRFLTEVSDTATVDYVIALAGMHAYRQNGDNRPWSGAVVFAK